MKGRFTNPLFPYANLRFPKELKPLQEIDEVIDIIKNGQWHTLESIIDKATLHEFKTNKILEFLANHNFIDLDNEHKKAKVTPSLMEFLKENQTSRNASFP